MAAATAVERLVPGQCYEYGLVQLHLSRYIFARESVKGKRVLDLGCGGGYGTSMLAQTASSVVGMEPSAEAVAQARSQYSGTNIAFVVGDAHNLPYVRSFDVIVLYEVIEHVRDPVRVLEECNKVLAVDGIVLCSTPNKALTSPLTPTNPQNQFHVHEFYSSEFDKLMRAFFGNARFYAQRAVTSESDARIVPFTAKDPDTRYYYPVDIGPNATDDSRYAILICVADMPRRRVPGNRTRWMLDASWRDELIQRLNMRLSCLVSEGQSKSLQIARLQEEQTRLHDEQTRLHNELELIDGALLFQLFRFVTSHIDRALPKETRRGAFREIVTRSLHVIASQGMRNFMRQATFKIRKRQLNVVPSSRSSGFPIVSAEFEYVRWLEANEINETSALGETHRLLYDIILFPIIDWSLRYQRPQQICAQFASKGHRVFYLCTSFKVGHGQDLPIGVRRIGENIYEVRLASAYSLSIYADEIQGGNLECMTASIDQLVRNFGIVSAVCLVDLPTWTPLVKTLKAKYGWRIVHDCMDRYSAFSTIGRKVVSLEQELSRTSDLVLASSLPIYHEQRSLNPNSVLVRNATDFAHFGTRPLEPDPEISDFFQRVRTRGRVIIGYYGAMAEWFDATLIRDVATSHPDWSIVLIGSTALLETKPLRSLQNVFLLGERQYESLPHYLCDFDVCIIPFVKSLLTQAVNPTKIYEYLSAGKPVVTVDLPELRELSGLVYLAQDSSDFSQKIEQALREDCQPLIEKRIAFARENTWEARFRTVSEAIRGTYPRVTIVVVSYNNLRLLKLCLRSIFAYTDYPNYEVILVDNASKDGTAEWATQFQKQCPELKVSLQDENVGFARAVNKGIEMSSGEYVAILNDDVLLTRGWLARLVQHLQNDPSIGLICTSTDFVGNEALYQTRFSRIARLQGFAFEFYRCNFGILFPLRTVAMFCVLMPRKVISEIGSLDEEFEVGMFEDDDYSYRARIAGFRTVCAGDVFVHHAGRASFKKLSLSQYNRLFGQNKRRFEEKWKMSWIPHGSPLRRNEVIVRSRELETIMQRNEGYERVAVLFPIPNESDSVTRRRSALADVFAKQGFKVFLIRDANKNTSSHGFRSAGTNTYVFDGPLEVLERIDRPVVVTSAQDAQNLVFFRNPIVVYECLDDPQAYETNEEIQRHHNGMLKRANVVLVDTESQLSKISQKRRDTILCTVESDFEKVIRDHLVTRENRPSYTDTGPCKLEQASKQVESRP